MAPIVSICIPAYKNLPFLERLLRSCLQQDFTDFEVVITDDSPNEAIGDWLREHLTDPRIRYIKNAQALGTPENWNASIREARGEWIKLMHNDDWFAHPTALRRFYEAAQANPGISFFFSAFVNITEATGHRQPVHMSWLEKRFLAWSPLHLFKKVYVGNPSCTFIRNGLPLEYNRAFKFVVDFDYYIRLIQAGYAYHYIPEALLHIGFHEEQVTQYTKFNPEVQIFENVSLLNQYGKGILRNVFVFDYYWRLFRNIGITNAAAAKQYLDTELPLPLKRMLQLQSRIPLAVLRVGIFSKVFMTVAYLRNLLFG